MNRYKKVTITTRRGRAELAGDYGEEKTVAFLERYAKNRHLIHKIITSFRYANNTISKSNEADLIFICNKGVFVIEVKAWRGILTRSSDSRQWIQNKFGQTRALTNPLFQNKKKVEFIRDYFGGTVPVYSLVVMTNNNAAGVRTPLVVNLNQLDTYFDSFHPSIHIPDYQIDAIYRLLQEKKDHDNISMKQHTANAIGAKYRMKAMVPDDLPPIIRDAKRKY